MSPESLERRVLLAAISDSGSDVLTIEFETDETITVHSTGDTYVLASTLPFSDGGAKGSFQGFGTTSLIVENLSDYSTLNIVDNGPGAVLTFADSTGPYQHQVNLVFDDLAGQIISPGYFNRYGITFQGRTEFTGDHGINLNADIHVTFENAILNAEDGDIVIRTDLSKFGNPGSQPAIRGNPIIDVSGFGEIMLDGHHGRGQYAGHGIHLSNFGGTTPVLSTNFGDIFLRGVGAEFHAGFWEDWGVSLWGVEVRSNKGDITLFGQARSQGTNAREQHGVYLAVDTTIEVIEGNILVEGHAGFIQGHGVVFDGYTHGSTPGGTGANLISHGSGSIEIIAEGRGYQPDGPDGLYLGRDSLIGGPDATGPILIHANYLRYDEPVIQTTGDLHFLPLTPGTNIGLGDGATGQLNLDTAFLGRLVDGFRSITIGDPDSGSGHVDIQDADFLDPVTIVGGTFNIRHLDAGSDPVDVIARTGSIVTPDGTASENTLGGSDIALLGDFAPGQALIDGNFQLNAGDTLSFEYRGIVAGRDYDQLRVIGAGRTVNIDGVDLRFEMSHPPLAADPIVIIDNVDSTSSVQGTFVGLPEGATLAAGDFFFTISYQGGSDQNDVVLMPSDAPNLILRIPLTMPSGASVGTVRQLGIDPTHDVTFTLLGGSGSQLLTIDSQTGRLFVADGMTLDFSTMSFYLLEVEIADATAGTQETVLIAIVPEDRRGAILWDKGTGLWHLGKFDGTRFSHQLGPRWTKDADWQFFEGDFNGDGFSDIAGRLGGTGRWWMLESSTDGSYRTRYWGSWTADATAGWQDVQVGDFNGDGRDDIIGRNNSGRLWVLQSDGSQFVPQNYGRWNSSGWITAVVGDFDGDGRDGIAGLYQSGDWFFSETSGAPAGQFLTQRVGRWSNPNDNWNRIIPGDFDGDGRTDLLGQYSTGDWWLSYSRTSTLETVFAGRWSTSVGFMEVLSGDFDGDGRWDITSQNSNGYWFVKRGLQTGMTHEGYTQTLSFPIQLAADYSLDGRTDIALYDSDGHWYLLKASATASRFDEVSARPWLGLIDVGFATVGTTVR
ncbi:MAG: VCBS repeat-containing protein [Planctomycetaceae bacterium]|nr:VCBS repeat-containing protein [Planctomycetaceae bacterium]